MTAPTSPPRNTSHPVTQQRDQQGLVRWTCPNCDWVTPWGRPGNASHGAAAVRHAMWNSGSEVDG